MLRQLVILITIPMLLMSGCAYSANKRHQARLQELDHLYKSGALDAVQYQAKYNEEVVSYNTKKMAASRLVGIGK